jgi:NAD(P)-dependent dehydrogenase (short-subunit alcohol dehydrogenase family)
MPTTLVAGATGATGRLLVAQLLDRGHRVRALVRSADRLPQDLRTHPRLDVIPGTVLDLPDRQLATHVAGCAGVASCLGHHVSARGIWGPPYRLVFGSVRRLVRTVLASRGGGAGSSPEPPVKLVLMGSAGVRDPDTDERAAWRERAALALLRALVPPHADNEQAARCLRTGVPRDDPTVAWAVVRPDTLGDSPQVTAYELHRSPTRSALFDAGRASRINVAHVMARLLDDDAFFASWRGRMPVLYDAGSS